MSLFICKFCKSERLNNNSLKQHERACKQNPDRKLSSGNTDKKDRVKTKAILINNVQNIVCCYGCNQEAQYINGSGKYTCEIISAKCPAIKLKNSNGLKSANKSGKRKDAKQIYADLTDDAKARMNWNKENYNADFSYDGKGSHKKVLIKERGHKCQTCLLTEWLYEPIPLELEHIDGDNRNNVKDNLLLLCPNCHAKTKFYRGKNKNTGKLKVTDEQILMELSKGISIRQVLLNVGLTSKGGNYVRVNDLKFASSLSPIGRGI